MANPVPTPRALSARWRGQRGAGLRCRLRGQRGMTLIEIAMVVGIMVLITGLVVPRLTNLTWLELRTGARKLSGAIRYTYELAARKSTPLRLVLDLDERAWWVEGSTDKVLLDREKVQVKDGALSSEPSAREQRFVTRSYIESGEMWKPKDEPGFAAYGDMLSPKVVLPERVGIQGVWTAHQDELVSVGQAYLYFFPSGQTERAVIHLVDEDENIYSLQVEGLTGRVRISPEYVEVPDE
jgi:general secretion pathway protein H